MKKLVLFFLALVVTAVACKKSQESQQQSSTQDSVVVIKLKNLEIQGDSLIGKKVQITVVSKKVCKF